MSKISDVTNQALKDLIGNMCLTKITLAATGGSTATVASTGTFTFTQGGLIFTHAALSAQSIVATHFLNGKLTATVSQIQPDPATLSALDGVQPTSVTGYYTLGVNAAGTICVSQGTWINNLGRGQNLSQFQMGATAVGDGKVPDVPTGYTPIGYMKVVNTTGYSFQAGVTNLNATGVTPTFTDVAILPAA